MFRKDEDELILPDKDWDTLKITAMNMLDREVLIATSGSEAEISEDDFIELTQRFWLMFYNSCVEYHIVRDLSLLIVKRLLMIYCYSSQHTVKPLSLFMESNTGMLCVVKKNRISFIRQTDLLETLYYFPFVVSKNDEDHAGN